MKAVIVGAGGFGKEIAFLLNRSSEYDDVSFVDDAKTLDEQIVGIPVIGTIDRLSRVEQKTAVFIGVASPLIKEKIFLKLKDNNNLTFPNLIDPTAIVGLNVKLGIGNILMPYTTYTADISIGDFNMFNIHSTIGHDSQIGNYNSIYPNVNLSGYTIVGNKNEIGVGTKVIPQVSIGQGNIIGAGSVIVKDILNNTKSVGVPAKIIESWDEDGK
ncbi:MULTISPECIES: acetyltransferase [Enterococcus]|uniref:PglD N-terminal domain-containing protein n=1 Tax=Candidatus Enterococcus mangumiae TaxID=2230878 RepID=A0ABZ2T3U0_9ENTE|nr:MULTISPECIES: acetyltransferase [unclassified Enterococcus]MBO0461274.1 acetyltransferase [Enterococcus sp. DIV1298c]MBO0490425.1 acetyltransferase [Enterococcus sp. DIV1094]MBO1299541.1 acetyltransferase [Enterococcus sp. DIV1271a]